MYAYNAAGELDCSCAAECPCATAEVARLRRALEDVQRTVRRAQKGDVKRPFVLNTVAETARRALAAGRLEVTLETPEIVCDCGAIRLPLLADRPCPLCGADAPAVAA